MLLKRNVIANYLGQAWSALMGIAFIPFYITYLGAEAYGLIGIYVLLQAGLSILDIGMTPTMNREMARFTAGVHTAQSIRNLLRSIEILSLCIATLIGFIIWNIAEWLSKDWLRAENIPQSVVSTTIIIMGWVISLRFIESIYRGALLGLQCQVFFNVINAGFSTVRGGGAVVVLALVSPTIEIFFLWQGLISMLSVIVMAVAANRLLPPSPKPPRFSWRQLMAIRDFAFGMLATTTLSILLTQVDKAILSRIISLETFGYYILAGSVAATIGLIISPITQAIYPRFTELVAADSKVELALLYHHGSQFVTVLAAPVALMLIFFSEEILILWTGNPKLATQVSPILAVMAAGSFLNGLMYIPYMLQLAYGWSSLAAIINLFAVFILIPAILWVTPKYGAVGAASIWLVLNLGYVLFAVQIMYRRLLCGEKWKWYWVDIIRPTAAATFVATGLNVFQPNFGEVWMGLLYLVLGGLATMLAALFATPQLLQLVLHRVNAKKRQYA